MSTDKDAIIKDLQNCLAKTKSALEESEAHRHAILQASTDSIMTLDASGTILTVNNSCIAMFGYSEPELLGKPITDLFSPPFDTRCLSTTRKDKTSYNQYFSAVAKDGRHVPIELTLTENLLPHRQIFTAIVRDISRRKEAEQKLAQKQKRIEEDLTAAAEIQRSLIPNQAPETTFFNISWKFTPSEHIGGDIFDIILLDDEHYAFYVLDVSGHGIPSALVAVSVSQVLDPKYLMRRKPPPERGWEILPPTIILDFLDRQFPIKRFNKFFTILYLVLNVRTGAIRYSLAGHPPPILIRANGERTLLDKGGPLIGLGGALPFEEGNDTLAPGDRIVMYTDGITEYHGQDNELFGMERFEKELARWKGKHLQDMTDGVFSEVLNFASGAPPKDDVTLLILEYNGASKSSFE